MLTAALQSVGSTSQSCRQPRDRYEAVNQETEEGKTGWRRYTTTWCYARTRQKFGQTWTQRHKHTYETDALALGKQRLTGSQLGRVLVALAPLLLWNVII